MPNGSCLKMMLSSTLYAMTELSLEGHSDSRAMKQEFRVKLMNARRNEIILGAFSDNDEPFKDISALYGQVKRPQFLFGIKVAIKSIEEDLLCL